MCLITKACSFDILVRMAGTCLVSLVCSRMIKTVGQKLARIKQNPGTVYSETVLSMGEPITHKKKPGAARCLPFLVTCGS